MLKRKWPGKYNGTGQLTWSGHIYSRALTRSLDLRRGRIYHGTWGAAPFQRLYQPTPRTLYSLSLMPEWYLTLPGLAGLAALGLLWPPLLVAAPLLALAVLVPIGQGWVSAGHLSCPSPRRSRLRQLGLRLVTMVLHVVHPVARLRGRLQSSRVESPVPWRSSPWLRSFARWIERGEAPHQQLQRLEQALRSDGIPVRRGGDWDRWDLEVLGGALGATRLIVAVEDHGAGRQFVRYRWWPSAAGSVLVLVAGLGGLSLAALLSGAEAAAAVLGVAAGGLALRTSRQCGLAAALIERLVRRRE